jgi:translation initiation factor 5
VFFCLSQLVGKVEGRGNGIKTRVVNCADIASALHRKPEVLIKFFGCALGCQSRWEPKEEAAIITGAFEDKQLQDKLCDEFLPKFVLCPNCGLPETDMKVNSQPPAFAQLPRPYRCEAANLGRLPRSKSARLPTQEV